MKIRIYSLLLLFSCSSPNNQYTELDGEIFGTYYSIHYKANEDHRATIEDLLDTYGKAVSKYEPESELSEFNETGKVVYRSPYLKDLTVSAKHFNGLSNGALNPTLMPLIEAWGFGSSDPQKLDSASVDSLLKFTDFSVIIDNDSMLTTSKDGVTLDLNFLGEGYGIDMIGDFLEREGIDDFKVEIGGEVLCKGLSPKGALWRIGIENPISEKGAADHLYAIISLEDEALGSSGSYRHFILDSLGRRQSHLLDPRTGYPIQHHLISATVKAQDCITADALATACMIMGEKEGKRMVESLEGIEALFVYLDDGVTSYWQSRGFNAEVLNP
ncbi:FAD:protein FMN transferase [Algoriphagus sp. NG3]|uniref:FAD:protein FMN transferase n=1 Tax=Algoriphagus sp. NG3 TaxID=3097546 RepID=UPI002A802F7A|nr:FAD:protein FMN transferase [Algoriphagus sp. NG3]WPR76922.1 FAD:protein FMN transferase [Algoriphagus sp. NG3]